MKPSKTQAPQFGRSAVTAATVVARAPGLPSPPAPLPAGEGRKAPSPPAGFAPPAALSPLGEGRAAPPEAIVPPLPPTTADRDKPTWPRNESEIDLPTEAPPAAPPLPAGMGYLGVVRGRCPATRGLVDLDVLVTGPDEVVFGSTQLSVDQALRLCKLLLLAVRVCDARLEDLRT